MAMQSYCYFLYYYFCRSILLCVFFFSPVRLVKMSLKKVYIFVTNPQVNIINIVYLLLFNCFAHFYSYFVVVFRLSIFRSSLSLLSAPISILLCVLINIRNLCLLFLFVFLLFYKSDLTIKSHNRTLARQCTRSLYFIKS